jgi:hypothetical protein
MPNNGRADEIKEGRLRGAKERILVVSVTTGNGKGDWCSSEPGTSAAPARAADPHDSADR